MIERLVYDQSLTSMLGCIPTMLHFDRDLKETWML